MRTLDLFTDTCSPKWQDLHLPDAEISLCKGWLPNSASVFHELHQQLDWRQPSLTLFGRSHKIPRLQVWMGDSSRLYRYSGRTFVPDAWLPCLDQLRLVLSELLAAPFNSVLANLYRDGRDGVGWHADNEPELGSEPCIASVSLGAARRFCLRRRNGAVSRPVGVELGAGDLLVMRGATQSHWLHACPKTRKAVAPRISLTFRYIQ